MCFYPTHSGGIVTSVVSSTGSVGFLGTVSMVLDLVLFSDDVVCSWNSRC